MRSWLMDQAARDLGIRSELEIRRSLEAEVTAKRWTRLDRLLAQEAGKPEGVVNLRPERDGQARSVAGSLNRPNVDI
jgi:type IV secretory pathway VirD2 relaxase